MFHHDDFSFFHSILPAFPQPFRWVDHHTSETREFQEQRIANSQLINDVTANVTHASDVTSFIYTALTCIVVGPAEL